MARKKQYNYFNTMELLSENAYLAAEHLETIFENYNAEELIENSEVIHQLEKKNDLLVDELTNQLYDAFITPIDREDILIISECLDDIIDGINSMTYLLENLVVTTIRPETQTFSAFVSRAAKGVHLAMIEFPKFKNSKKLKQLILEVNEIESEGDLLYSRLKKQLFSEEKDLLEIIKWKEIYDCFESIINDTERVVDIIDGMIIKNT
ncbi:MAG TPA: DUF47 family protein [Enterococcus aquimarinus]|nr:DUF47 family protein [Enterococcus aquimarinus]